MIEAKKGPLDLLFQSSEPRFPPTHGERPTSAESDQDGETRGADQDEVHVVAVDEVEGFRRLRRRFVARKPEAGGKNETAEPEHLQ